MYQRDAQATAKLLGISPRKVERARTVLEHAPEEVKEMVKAGEMSLYRAYQAAKLLKPA